MKTKVADTSIQTYHNTTDQRQRQADRILWQVKQHRGSGTCVADLAAIMNLDKSTVAGRVNELKTAGKLTFVGKRYSVTTGRLANFYKWSGFTQSLF